MSLKRKIFYNRIFIMLNQVSKTQNSLGISNLIHTLLHKYITTDPSYYTICICQHIIHET